MPDIRASIGIRNGTPCYNRISDQRIVAGLLNRIPQNEGGSLETGGAPAAFPKLEERQCSPELHQAIRRFQKAHAGEIPFEDGHVDPGQNTIRLLNRLADADRPKLVVSRNFIFQVIDLPGYHQGPLGAISAFNDVSTRMTLYRFGPRALWEPLRLLAQGAGSWNLTTSEAVSTDAFNGPVTISLNFRSQTVAVYHLSLTVNLASGTTVHWRIPISTRTAMGGFFSGEMHPDESSLASMTWLQSVKARV